MPTIFGTVTIFVSFPWLTVIVTVEPGDTVVLPEGDWLITLPCSTESLYDCFTDTLNPADSSSDDAST